MSARGKIQKIKSFNYNGINFDIGTKDYLSIQIKNEWLDLSKNETINKLKNENDNYLFYGIPKSYLMDSINSVN